MSNNTYMIAEKIEDFLTQQDLMEIEQETELLRTIVRALNERVKDLETANTEMANDIARIEGWLRQASLGTIKKKIQPKTLR